MPEERQDPWVQVRTFHQFAADEVISALQKEIRRGNVENAALLAYEMYLTSGELENYLWKRLLVISVEDIGFGDPYAPILVNNLYQMHLSYDRSEGDRLLFAIQAVRFLCACQKDRSTDEMVNWMKFAVENTGLRALIPDYALDVHTSRGKKMGRGTKHFWEEGAKLSPELLDRNLLYRDRMMDILNQQNLE